MLRREELKQKLEVDPIIIAITDEETYKIALKSEDEVVFLLDANIANVKSRVEKLIEHGKFPFLHIDMVNGMTSTPAVVDYIANTFNRKCGVITTKPNLVKVANQLNIRVIHRTFLVEMCIRDRSDCRTAAYRKDRSASEVCQCDQHQSP